MSRYRASLPQANGELVITDGGLETDLLFHDGFDLPLFAAFPLVADAAGREALRRYYDRYADIARDDQDRVIRPIEAAVIGERILTAQFLDLMAPADHRRAIGMVDIKRRQHAFLQLRAGIAVRAHLAFLDHDIALGKDFRPFQHEAGHAVGLQRHHRAEMFFGHALVIGGVIIRGEGVFLPAKPGDEFRKLTLGMLCRALEHQMLKKMRDAGIRIQVGGHGQLQGLGTVWEMWMLTQGGMTPWQALRAGTIDGADYIGYSQDLGSLEAGKRADLVIVNTCAVTAQAEKQARRTDSAASFAVMNSSICSDVAARCRLREGREREGRERERVCVCV